MTLQSNALLCWVHRICKSKSLSTSTRNGHFSHAFYKKAMPHTIAPIWLRAGWDPFRGLNTVPSVAPLAASDVIRGKKGEESLPLEVTDLKWSHGDKLGDGSKHEYLDRMLEYLCELLRNAYGEKCFVNHFFNVNCSCCTGRSVPLSHTTLGNCPETLEALNLHVQ